MPALTMKALRARFEADLHHAETAILKDGHLAPMFAVTPTDGPPLPVVADFGSPEAKHACLTAVRLLCIATNAVTAMYMGEAWMVAGELPAGVSPGQSERRVEVVMVSLEGRIGREVKRLARVREILRGLDGKPSGLRPLALPGVTAKTQVDVDGPMARMLPPRQPGREQRVIARAMVEHMGLLGAETKPVS